ncbi:hypothetical protein Holit_02691 [Hollandina sp. SP2]
MRTAGVIFTRIRSYLKNDQGYLELKNGEVVRKTDGYARSTTEEALAAVYRVRKALRNSCYSWAKLDDKPLAAQGKTKKGYVQSATPYKRLLAGDEVRGEEAAEHLRHEDAWESGLTNCSKWRIGTDW